MSRRMSAEGPVKSVEGQIAKCAPLGKVVLLSAVGHAVSPLSGGVVGAEEARVTRQESVDRNLMNCIVKDIRFICVEM